MKVNKIAAPLALFCALGVSPAFAVCNISDAKLKEAVLKSVARAIGREANSERDGRERVMADDDIRLRSELQDAGMVVLDSDLTELFDALAASAVPPVSRDEMVSAALVDWAIGRLGD